MTKAINIIPVSQEIIYPDNGELLSLEYFLRCYYGPEGETLYGMRIDMRYPGGDLLEREETPALSASIADIAVLTEAFAEGTVMPGNLLEMIDEWFCPETKRPLLTT